MGLCQTYVDKPRLKFSDTELVKVLKAKHCELWHMKKPIYSQIHGYKIMVNSKQSGSRQQILNSVFFNLSHKYIIARIGNLNHT